MKAFGETDQSLIFKEDLAIQAGEITNVKNILIQNGCNEIIDQSIESEKKLVMKEEKVGTKKIVLMPGSGSTQKRTSLSFNFQE